MPSKKLSSKKVSGKKLHAKKAPAKKVVRKDSVKPQPQKAQKKTPANAFVKTAGSASHKPAIERNVESQAYVWIWLPGEITPVVCGVVEADDGRVTFTYASSYLKREHKISISPNELPLSDDLIEPHTGLSIPGAIRDAAPDAWGRRVILNKKYGKKILEQIDDPYNEIAYLLESGSDRIGALDFQVSPTNYVSRPAHQTATLEELLSSAQRVDQGVLLTPELDQAIQHGTSIGGARPKALINSDRTKFIAKFSSASDTYDVVKTEFVAMRLAAMAGIDVAPVQMTSALGKDVLLIERFDRAPKGQGFERKALVSALSLLGLDEMMARWGSYKDLTDIIRQKFDKPGRDLEELFRRLVFNILVSNNDDHARNHAALWDGKNFNLSPAYDLCPQKRTGRESNQAMIIANEDRRSLLEVSLSAAPNFLLTRNRAIEITENLMEKMIKGFGKAADEANLSAIGRALMLQSQVFNEYAFEELGADASSLTKLRKKLK